MVKHPVIDMMLHDNRRCRNMSATCRHDADSVVTKRVTTDHMSATCQPDMLPTCRRHVSTKVSGGSEEWSTKTVVCVSQAEGCSWIRKQQKLNGLEDAYKHWETMDVIAPRTAANNESLVGGQGIFSCKCKGKCNTNSCKCFQNNRICTSACHRNSKCCDNNDVKNLFEIGKAVGKP